MNEVYRKVSARLKNIARKISLLGRTLSLKNALQSFPEKQSPTNEGRAPESTDKFNLAQVEAKPLKNHPLFEQLFAQAISRKDYYVPLSSHQVYSEQLKYIAFYHPQYIKSQCGEEMPDDSELWPRVAKSVPQFEGHYQPHLPDELGFYDLRWYAIFLRQIELAKHYGIYGFCFYIGMGSEDLSAQPLQHLQAHPELDIPFCLAWDHKNKIEQEADNSRYYIESMIWALTDPRYIRLNEKPLLMVSQADLLPDPAATARYWRQYCREQGVGEIILIMSSYAAEINPLACGFDAIVDDPPAHSRQNPGLTASQLHYYNPDYQGQVYDYQQLVEQIDYQQGASWPRVSSVFPAWDNEACGPARGKVFINSSPMFYQAWLEKASEFALAAPLEQASMVFINAWNNWSEGAHLEPDRRYGYAYLQATAAALQMFDQPLQQQIRASQQVLQKKHPIAVILHLYYPELWPEIQQYLANIAMGFDLYISLPAGVYRDEVQGILKQYHGAHLYCFENKGRDVAPFLEIMHNIRPLNYQYVCKLHSKKSLYFSQGKTWRDELFTQLLGQPADKGKRVQHILQQFEQDDSIGMISPAGYYIPLKGEFLGSNQAAMERIMCHLGQKVDYNSRFIAGTMFWCRPQALALLDKLTLSCYAFETENGQRDGTVAHAMERLLAQIAQKSEYRITEIK